VAPPVAPQVVPNGGPLGAGDQYLQITSLGGAGAGSRMVAINSSQWAGDYLSSGISGIAMDLRNFGNSDLTIRLLLEDPVLGPPADVAVTTFGFALPAGGGWTRAFFAIAPSSMTALSGDVNTLLGNTTFLRIIDSPTPANAVPIVGVLGVDNISAVPDESVVPEPATLLPVFGVLVWLVVARRAQGRG
jgi:hypothetical protein